MNYQKIYDALIWKRAVYERLDPETKGENHHIVPVSEGGLDVENNIVRLTVKEHIFAHQLLARIYNDNKMWFAAHILLQTKDNSSNKCLRLAEIARQKQGVLNSGVHHWNYGKHHSNKTKKKIADALKGGHSNLGCKWSDEAKSHHVGSRGKHLSSEHKRKLSIANRGKVVSLTTRMKLRKACGKPVIQYDEQMNYIGEWESAKQAALSFGAKWQTHIIACCRGKRKLAFGFIWKYKDDVGI